MDFHRFLVCYMPLASSAAAVQFLPAQAAAVAICHLSEPHDRMDALERALKTPEVSGPLSWGVACASAASLHAYASLFAAVPRPKTRVLRSLDVGVVIFAISSTLAYYNQPRPDE